MSDFSNNLSYLRVAAHASSFPNGEGGKTPPWEIDWFYRDPAADGSPGLTSPENLNAVCRAYLGDRAAQTRLTFGEATDAELDAALIEGPYGLNERQRLAVRRALESDISLVQGPPGTGKTETILNMVSCMIARGATVAVVSTNGEAIANISKKVAGYATADEGREPNRRRVFGSYAALGKLENRETWNEGHPRGPRFEVGDDPEARRNERHDTGGWEPALSASEFLRERPFITSTIHSLKKCFHDGDTFLYDYLIMDEASQCAPALALLAMSSARRVVLVGDVEQLPPVYHASAAEAAAHGAEEAGIAVPGPGSPYALQDASTGDGMSILASARAVFEPIGVPHTFLNEHFRCHPGIIGFCSEEIYAPCGEGLDVRTPSYDRSVQTPIRIRWFEGDYWEPHRRGRRIGNETPHRNARRGPSQSSKENRKQIEIFLHEEWPTLRARLEADPTYSARIVSPFRGQLEALYERLIDEEGAEVVERLFHADEAEAVDAWETTGMTIHKTQGREYNAVYLLPVEDGDWDWPWSQGRSIVNVAVSRAKDELVLICSADLMSKGTQLALTGTYVPPLTDAASPRLSEGSRAKRESHERFLQKLVEYARRRMDPASPSFTGEVGFPAGDGAYGFRHADLISIFDEIPAIRSHVDDGSAAELALLGALGDVDLAGRGLAAARGVPLSRCFSPAMLRHYLTDDAEFTARDKALFVRNDDEGAKTRFDLVVYERETLRLVMCIQVDDGDHRHTNPAAPRDDERALARRRLSDRCRDAVARNLGARVLEGNRRVDLDGGEPASFAFTMLHLATNGTAAFETGKLAKGIDPHGPYAGMFATIDELIDLQLSRGRTNGPVIDPSYDLDARPITAPEAISRDARATMGKSDGPEPRYLQKVLDDWAERDLFPAMRSRQANKLLMEAGLIEKHGDDWLVTPRGELVGIIQRSARYNGVEKTRCLYPADCEEALRAILLDALGA